MRTPDHDPEVSSPSSRQYRDREAIIDSASVELMVDEWDASWNSMQDQSQLRLTVLRTMRRCLGLPNVS